MCTRSSGLLIIMLLIVDTVLFPVGLTLDLPYVQLWKTSFCLIFAIYLFGISPMHIIYFMVSMDRSPSLSWHYNISHTFTRSDSHTFVLVCGCPKIFVVVS